MSKTSKLKIPKEDVKILNDHLSHGEVTAFEAYLYYLASTRSMLGGETPRLSFGNVDNLLWSMGLELKVVVA